MTFATQLIIWIIIFAILLISGNYIGIPLEEYAIFLLAIRDGVFRGIKGKSIIRGGLGGLASFIIFVGAMSIFLIPLYMLEIISNKIIYSIAIILALAIANVINTMINHIDF